MITQNVKDLLKDVLTKANAAYKIEYEESSMMNAKNTEEYKRSDSFAYIEEFKSGYYDLSGNFSFKDTALEIYFCKFTHEFQGKAEDREEQRYAIEQEIVLPFIKEYKASGYFQPVDRWMFFYPPARFDGNEVSVLLQFMCRIPYC